MENKPLVDKTTYTTVPGEEEDSVRSGKKSSVPAIGIAAIVLGCVILVAAAVALVCVFAIPRDPKYDYGVIIDAGSSGSRVYVYQWPHRKDNSTIPVVSPLLPPESLSGLREVKSTRSDLVNTIKPGIAKIDPENISTYLKPLIDYADSLVPSENKNNAPFFLFATAGMRLIPEDRQKAIIDAVRKTLSKTGFSCEDDWARVISGSEEGVFGWVTANYLKKILFKEDAKDHVVGALDLGGASLQITFLPDEKPKENVWELPLPHNIFKLYTYSFLKYGQDKTMENVIQLCVDDQTKGGVVPEIIEFPCYLSGYNETLVIDGVNHTLVGTGDFAQCAEYEKKFMNLTAQCKIEPCSIDGVYQPEVKGEFYAMSGFYYTASFFGFASETQKIAPFTFLKYGSEYCQTSWEKAVEQHSDVDVDLLKLYCFTSSYIYSILTSGFHFGVNSTDIYFTSSISGTTLNWALGGLIAEASLLPKN